MSTPGLENAAAQLVAARRDGRNLTGFPGPHPASMAEAYRVQEHAMSLWPDTLVGWKIGYIPADRRAPGEPDRLVGPIWQRQLRRAQDHGAPPEMAVFGMGFAAVEAELVIRLEVDVPDRPGAGWTAEEAADLDQQLLFGIEVASSPIPDINSLGPTVIAADFGNNNGLVLGASLTRRPGQAPIGLSCSLDGQQIGAATSDTLPGGMHSGLATALNVLADRGRPVRAGTLFATGAVTGIHPVTPGQHCRVQVDGGPFVELRTVDAAAIDAVDPG